MTSALATPTVTHDEAHRRFICRLPEGDCELTYQIVQGGPHGATIMDIDHTFTVPAARGKGIAAQLAAAAFGYAKARGMAVKPSCPYISGNYLSTGADPSGAFKCDRTGLAVLK
jgi:predicted GNAT family acetyltransferase